MVWCIRRGVHVLWRYLGSHQFGALFRDWHPFVHELMGCQIIAVSQAGRG